MRDVYEKAHSELLDTLPPTQRAVTRSAGGKGAAAWMYPPTDAPAYMPFKHYLIAPRYRTHEPF